MPKKPETVECELDSVFGLAALTDSARVNTIMGTAGSKTHKTKKKARPKADDDKRHQAETCNSRELTWDHLAVLAEIDPQIAITRWDEVKKLARDDLDSGNRAAAAVSFQDSPWELGRFLATRESIAEEWLPANGIEGRLIDMMAHAYEAWLFWLERGTTRSHLNAVQETHSVGEFQKWSPPTIGEAAGLEQAVAMAERFNRIFLRTLRALRDLRRYAPNVTIQSAGQVNIGAQQVNAAHVDQDGNGARQ